MLQGPRMQSRGMQQRFMGPGSFGRPSMRPHPMQSSPFGHRPMIPQRQYQPMILGRGPGTKQGSGGGLLAKLLGKGRQGNGMPGFLSSGGTARGTASGGGILKTLTDPAALNGFLNNTQQVLKTAQQFGPMIQQYGPLVRNLPSMWKLYKGLKDLPDAEGQPGTSEKNSRKGKSKGTAKNTVTEPISEKASPKKPAPKGVSSPKLFI